MTSNLTYTRSGDYYIPNISISDTANHKLLGKFGRMRKAYLQEHRPVLWDHMVLSETLCPHWREIDNTAYWRLKKMMPELVKLNGVTEDLKANDLMKWVGLMNSIKSQAEETILNELICN